MLKKEIQNKLLYDNEIKDKEDAMNKLFSYLLAQYKPNAEMSSADPVIEIYELRLYRVKWDWTETPIHEVIQDEELIYSTTAGLLQYE